VSNASLGELLPGSPVYNTAGRQLAFAADASISAAPLKANSTSRGRCVEVASASNKREYARSTGLSPEGAVRFRSSQP
jgi:hypothetical protein